VREPGWSGYPVLAAHPIALDVPLGTTVSIVALEPGTRVTVEGATWPLENAVLPLLSGLGISNRALGGPFTVTATSGIVVIIVLDER
jgi:thiamine pyrophosphokinase